MLKSMRTVCFKDAVFSTSTVHQGPQNITFLQYQLAIPKLMSGLGTSVKKCPN